MSASNDPELGLEGVPQDISPQPQVDAISENDSMPHGYSPTQGQTGHNLNTTTIHDDANNIVAQSMNLGSFNLRSSWAKELPERGGFAAVEVLYRHNLLWARAQLYKHFLARRDLLDWGDPVVFQNIRDELDNYSKALRDYREFRSSGPAMFKDNDELMKVSSFLVTLEHLETSTVPPATPEAITQRKAQMDLARSNLSSYYSERVLGEMKSGLRYSMRLNTRKAFYGRLIMALLGGVALIVPMLIMTLHQGKLTSLLTTSLFVLAVAVLLAKFMDGAEPKDIIGASAAYAAVLVVFVGTGTSSAVAG